MTRKARVFAVVVGSLMGMAIGIVLAQAQVTTKLPDGMVQPPVTSFTAVRVLTPQGWVLAQPDSTIQIDTTSNPPVIRAVVPSARIEQTDAFLVTTPSQSFHLSAAPASAVRAYRNGLLMAEGYDYSISGQDVTFVSGQQIGAGDIMQFAYWRQP